MNELAAIPETETAQRALDLAAALEKPAIFNHSVRTFLHAGFAAREEGLSAGSDFDADTLFYACVLHDIGTADEYDGPQRFEVEGADAAVRFLAEHGIVGAEAERVWEAIALHTSSGIAERLGPITRLTRAGVMADFGDDIVASATELEEIEVRYPRFEIERVLSDAVIAQALAKPGKAEGSSWARVLVHWHREHPGSDEAF